MVAISSEKILIVESDPAVFDLIARQILMPLGYQVSGAVDGASAIQMAVETQPDVIIVDLNFPGLSGKDLLVVLSSQGLTIPVIVLAEKGQETSIIQAFRLGASDFLMLPLREAEVVSSVERALKQVREIHAREKADRQIKKTNASLQRQVRDLSTVVTVGRALISLTDQCSLSDKIVEAAAIVSGADYSWLTLKNEETNTFFLAAHQNLPEELARESRDPLDPDISQFVSISAEKLSIHGQALKKLNIATLGNSAMAVPVIARNNVIGILTVVRKSEKPFDKSENTLCSAIADYASISLVNARLIHTLTHNADEAQSREKQKNELIQSMRLEVQHTTTVLEERLNEIEPLVKLYDESQRERARLGTLIMEIQDGVILLDKQNNMILINPAARKAFSLGLSDVTNLPVLDVIPNDQFKVMLESVAENPLKFHEMVFEDGRVFNTQYTPIPEIGAVITLEDITHLKMIDRLKSDLVHTIAHDLRSPLTAIMGYVELLERVGPLNTQQKEFVKLVQNSAQDVTALVDDLLNLGRIETGFDSRKDDISFGTILRHTIGNLGRQIEDKNQDLQINIAPDLPILRGNPIRLRQLMDNLLVNSIKYTPTNGKISVNLRSEADQIILEVIDTGIGIPDSDQPHIFEKFYRGENFSEDTPGTGLGLAIVKKIVENHSGRIFVESAVGKGTKVVVILPTFNDQNH